MPRLVDLPDSARKLKLTHGFTEDFDHFITADRWTVTASDLGGATEQDAAGGVVLLDASDGTVADNDETYLHLSNEIFLWADDRPLVFAARVQYAEANTDDANIIVGLMDAWAADSILDDGAGPSASYSGAVFFKVDGGTNWNVECSLGGTQTTVELTAANSLDGLAKTAGGSNYQWLEIRFKPYDATSDLANVDFFIDGVHVYTISGYDYTSATAMEVGFGVKNGGANEETLSIDATYCYQKR